MLLGISFFSETVAMWLQGTTGASPTLGGFLYVTIASTAAGLTVSTIRWLVVDTIHHATGIPRPEWDFSQFHTKVPGYDRLAAIHYDYYKFYANMMIALACTFLAVFVTVPELIGLGLIIAFPTVEIVFFLGSRDTLRKSYARISMLLGQKSGPTAGDLPDAKTT